MPIQPGVWGIDLGQCALKAVRIEEVDGQLSATAFDYVEHPKILSQPDADPDQLTREALEKFLSRNTLKGDVVSISVPGQSGLARFVKLPPVEEKKIADIVRFEAKQQIPFNLDEVVWDYQRIGKGDVTDGFAMNIEIGLFAMKRDMINRYLQHFKDVGVEIHFVQMAPLALCNFVSYDLLGRGAQDKVEEGEEDKGGCVVALDIGADSSNLVITDANRVIWQRPIPLGGNHFTRALTKELKLTFAKAEHLKRNATKSPDLKKILTALKPVLNDFVGEVQRSLGYFTNTHRDAQVEYMVGLGNAFRLPGLQRYLGEKLSLEVRKLGKMERLSGESVLTQPAFSENVLTFGVAYGLALQGLKQARLLTNLLPNEIRVARLVRAKKPWAAAAAALLLLGPGALAFKSYREAKVYLAPEVASAITNADNATKAVSQKETEYSSAKAAADKERDAVRSIVAGQPEYKNWLELTKFVNDCLPRPNGDNLPIAKGDPNKKPDYYKDLYFKDLPKVRHLEGVTPMSGKDAFKEYNARLAGKMKSADGPLKDDFGAGVDDLVQITIQSFDARFCDDLATYWNGLDKDKKNEANVRPKEQATKTPDGKGWIVEIQGYTYHYEGENFLRDTLLETLAAKGIPDAGKGGGGKDAPAGGKDIPATGKPAPGAPAPGAPAPAGGAPGAAGGKDKEEVDIPPEGPVVNRISHILLFQKRVVPVQHPDQPLQIESKLAEVIKGGAANQFGPGGGLGVPGKPGGPTAPAPSANAQPSGGVGGLGGAGAPANTGFRDSWTPLGSFASTSPTPGGYGMPQRPGAEKTRTPMPRPMEPGAVPVEGDEKFVKHERTEFIILFIWKEPTPSAPLRKEEQPPPELAPTGGTTSPGGATAPAAPAAPAGGGGGGGGLRNLDGL